VASSLDASSLDVLLAKHCAAAAQAWPSLQIDDVRFVTHLAGRMHPDVDAQKGLRDLHAADLYLALACGLGEHRALLELEKMFEALPGPLARLAQRAPVDEVIQNLRTKLLVAKKDAPPKILDYAGRGPLAGWLRVAAIRTAVSMGRKSNVAAACPITREVLLAVPDLADNPEIAHLRARYKTEFKTAFEAAVAALDPQQRTVLRMSLVDGLSIDQLCVVFAVHRATAARWIQRAMDAVQEGTRERLVEQLELSGAELEGVLGIVQTSVELSIQRVLREDA
jgi:RNA polymerase sigma-70 factor (ECF subfamily)